MLKAFSVRKAFLFLFLWLLLGFLLRWDYTLRVGCVGFQEPFWEFRNIVFSGLSFGLLLIAFLSKQIKIQQLLCIGELGFWLSKLMLIKGGYLVGFGAIPDISILFFDTVSLLIRLYILFSLFGIKSFKSLIVFVCTIVLIALKILFFALPMLTF